MIKLHYCQHDVANLGCSIHDKVHVYCYLNFLLRWNSQKKKFVGEMGMQASALFITSQRHPLMSSCFHNTLDLGLFESCPNHFSVLVCILSFSRDIIYKFAYSVLDTVSGIFFSEFLLCLFWSSCVTIILLWLNLGWHHIASMLTFCSEFNGSIWVLRAVYLPPIALHSCQQHVLNKCCMLLGHISLLQQDRGQKDPAKHTADSPTVTTYQAHVAKEKHL